MAMSLRILLTILLFCMCQMMHAISAKISISRLEHNLTENNQKGLKVHFHLDIVDGLGREVYVFSAFDSEPGYGLLDTNGSYRLGNGVIGSVVCVPVTCSPGVLDYYFFMPYDELHQQQNSKVVLNVHCAVIADCNPLEKIDNNKILAWSDWVPFTLTTGTPIPVNNNTQNNSVNNNAPRKKVNNTTPRNNVNYNPLVGTTWFYTNGRAERAYCSFYYDDSKRVYRAQYGTPGNASFFVYSGISGDYWVYRGDKLLWNMDYTDETIWVAVNGSKMIWQKGNVTKTYDKPSNRSDFENFQNALYRGLPQNESSNESGSNRRRRTSSSSGNNKCNQCYGTGNCQRCKSTGGSYEDVGYYVGKNVKSWVNCPACGGSGRCKTCHGSGRVR